MYFKAFTDNRVLLIQARNETDIQRWMQREFNCTRRQYALIRVTYEQLAGDINAGNHLMLVPAGQLAKPLLKHRIRTILSPKIMPLRGLLANATLFGWPSK